LFVRQWALAFAVGAAVVSTFVALLGFAGLAHPAVFLITAAVCVIANLWGRMASCAPVVNRRGGRVANPPQVDNLPYNSRTILISVWLAVAIFLAFGLYYLVSAAAPEVSGDGSGYHLAEVRRYFNAHRIYPIPTSMYAMFPQGMEMLFWVAYALGRHAAAALVHLGTLIALAAAMIAYSRRFLTSFVGGAAALIVFVAPVVGIDGSSAYVDVALALAAFSAFFLVQLWDADRSDSRLLAALGLVSGFCIAIKYTGAVALAYALAFVAYRARRVRPVLLVAAAAALVMAPWVTRNWVWYQNPSAPFFNRLFPNDHIRVALEDQYRDAMRHYHGASLGLSTPVEVTLKGGLLEGTIGPAFLLAPLGLLSLRTAQGRQLLLAFAVFAAPYVLNIGTRFLIPALPFLALAMLHGLCFQAPPVRKREDGVGTWAVVAIVAAQAIASWPAILSLYCAPYSWRLAHFPIRAALGVETEQSFLERNLAPWYQVTQMLQQRTPVDAVIYTAQPLPEAYTDRTVWLDYAAALPNRVRDLLASALAHPGTRRETIGAISSLSVTHLLIHDLEPLGPAIASDPARWGLKLIARTAPMNLYQISIDSVVERRNN
jgi:4-amino-4-deoxy-L-arabinose transferase-like glycosyltransferase